MNEYPTKYLFYSKELDKYTHSLNDFKGYHPVSSKAIEYFYYYSKDIELLYYDFYTTGVTKLNPIRFSYLDGVETVDNLNFDLKFFKINTFNWFKNKVIDILDNEVQKLKGKNNILFLSDGVDSWTLLYFLYRNNIDFLAIHIYGKEYPIDIINHQKKFKYNLELLNSNNIDTMLFARQKYLEYNPMFNSFGSVWDITYGAILLDSKYKKYENILLGWTPEVSVGQSACTLYLLAPTEVEKYNDLYGSHLKIENNKEKIKLCLSSFSDYTDYYLKRLSQLKVADKLENLTGKKIVNLWDNLDIVRSVATLDLEARIKNTYKLLQYEILTDNNFYLKRGTSYGVPTSYYRDVTNKQFLDYYGIGNSNQANQKAELVNFVDWYDYYINDVTPNNYQKDKSYYKKRITQIYMEDKIKNPNSYAMVNDYKHTSNRKLWDNFRKKIHANKL